MAPRRNPRGRQYRVDRAKFLALPGNDRCYIDGQPIYLDAPRYHPQKATVDHVVPVSQGGADHPDNWRPCCRQHNIRRGDRPITSILPPVRRSREW